jgi:hypothetical protein
MFGDALLDVYLSRFAECVLDKEGFHEKILKIESKDTFGGYD